MSYILSTSGRANPDPLYFPDADVIVAPVVKRLSFRVRVSRVALRDFDAPGVREVVRSPRCAQRVAANPRPRVAVADVDGEESEEA
jgi:hypothetical protein